MLKCSPAKLLMNTMTVLDKLWTHAAGQQYPTHALYVVATPIGNITDISVRALYVLNMVNAVACEDTRHSKQLFASYTVDKPLIAVHDHNELEKSQYIIERLQAGERIALVTDAGTPAVSDPGSRLVAAVHAAGIRVIPIAGASAAVTAMSAAGLDGGFHFHGFLPNKSTARQATFNALSQIQSNIIFYEAPHRLLDTLADLALLFPDRQLVIAKELTKLHESIISIDLKDYPTWQAQAPEPRGEYVLVLSQPEAHESNDAEWEKTLSVLIKELPLKQAVSLTCQISGAAKNAVYTKALALKNTDAR